MDCNIIKKSNPFKKLLTYSTTFHKFLYAFKGIVWNRSYWNLVFWNRSYWKLVFWNNKNTFLSIFSIIKKVHSYCVKMAKLMFNRKTRSLASKLNLKRNTSLQNSSNNKNFQNRENWQKQNRDLSSFILCASVAIVKIQQSPSWAGCWEQN